MAAASVSNSLLLTPAHLSSGSCFKPSQLGITGCTPLSLAPLRLKKTAQRALVVQAAYGDGGRPSSASIFIGGFILGGLAVGALSCVYAPQISKALADTDKKDLMRKLPKFIYDEEKALEKQRQKLSDKIEQLNSAIDDASAQLRNERTPFVAAGNSDGIDAYEATA